MQLKKLIQQLQKNLRDIEKEEKKRTTTQQAKHTHEIKYRKTENKEPLEQERTTLERNYNESETRFRGSIEELEG